MNRGRLCFRDGKEGCQGIASIIRTCQVEGSDLALCRACDEVWKAEARNSPELSVRCMRCAPLYLSVRGNASGDGPATPTRIIPRNEQTGPLYSAIDQAMFAEGLLVDVRRRVLDRLSSNEDFRLRNAAELTPDAEVAVLAAS